MKTIFNSGEESEDILKITTQFAHFIFTHSPRVPFFITKNSPKTFWQNEICYVEKMIYKKMIKKS